MFAAPLISVVMSAYNGSRYIAEQLDSILAQSYPAVEITCVDDHSTDDTPVILDSYRRRYPGRIAVHTNASNVGSRKTFEQGVRLARGAYIAFADQDDWWYPGKLETLYAAIATDPALAFVYSNSELVDESLRTIRPRTWRPGTAMLTGRGFYGILNDNTVMGCSMLVEGDFARQCLPFPGSGYHHDWYLAIMALGRNRPIAYVDQVLFKYRRHAGNQVNRERRGRSRNSTRFRALRTYRETAGLPTANFDNEILHELVLSKQELFRNILLKRPRKALAAWRRHHGLLEEIHAVDRRVRASNLRYIFYSLFWRKASERELA